MKIPSKIPIKGKLWSVGYKWRLHDEKHGDCDGLTDWVEQTIWLDRAASREDKIAALLHEIIHILCDEYNMHLTGGIKDEFAEEILCAGLARDLPEIFNMKFNEKAWNAVARSRSKS